MSPNNLRALKEEGVDARGRGLLPRGGGYEALERGREEGRVLLLTRIS